MARSCPTRRASDRRESGAGPTGPKPSLKPGREIDDARTRRLRRKCSDVATRIHDPASIGVDRQLAAPQVHRVMHGKVRAPDARACRIDVPVAHDRVNVRRVIRSRRKVRSEEHTSELQSLMRISYAVFCLKKKNKT